jgi:hypothetical protein
MSPKQIVILIFVVLVLAVAFALKQVWLPGPSTGPPPPDDKVRSPLEIVSDAQGSRYEEEATEGHHSFRYKNTLGKPILVGVNWKNCKCASVEICTAPEEWKSYPAAELAKRAGDSTLQWHRIDQPEQSFEIPAEAIGWVRLGWKGDKRGDQLFSADLWLYEPDSGLFHHLEVPVIFVEAVRVRWEEDIDRLDAYVGKLREGGEASGKFVFWSSTRPKFTLEADPPKDDPCVSYGEPVPLSVDEMGKLTKTQGRKVLSGYRVEVTVRERAGGTQLDIGPFRRLVAWKSNAVKEPITAHVAGIVLGEVNRVSGDPDRPVLDLGTINPQRPAPTEIILESENLQVELTLDEKRSTDLFKVEVPEGKPGKVVNAGGVARKTWTVSIAYNPETGFRGRFPDRERSGYETCGIVFKITHVGVKKEPERSIRVMVGGQVKDQ